MKLCECNSGAYYEQLSTGNDDSHRMKFNVSKAKKKIKQQTEYIRLLESQQGLPHNVSAPPVEPNKTNFNKTGVSLFGESPVSRATSTPHSGQVMDRSSVQIPEQSIGDIDERTLTDECTSESTDVSEEEVFIVQCDVTGVDATRAESQIYPLIADPPQTCVSLFGNSVQMSPRRPLQLKRQTNRIKYKETNSNISPESASSSNYENHTQTSPNILSETELPSPDLSECHSPPFLGSSPHKTTPSTPVTYGAASVSMFYSTTKVDNDSTTFKTPPPGTRTNPIPLSDSQFSLDVSQSFPPSPELCGGSSDSIQSRKSYQQHSIIPNTLGGKQQYLPGRTVGNNVLLKTPSISLVPNMIPITPGITTVQSILDRASTYMDSDKNQYFNGTTSNRSKRRVSADIEGIVPARKKLHSDRVDESFQAGHNDEDYSDSKSKCSPDLMSGATTAAGTASNLTKGRGKCTSNDEDGRA